MKVIHIGNVGNFAYNYVKFLRKQGFEADLLVRKNCPETMDPAHEDPEIKRRPPKWIKYWNRKYPWSTVALTPMVRKYDLVHAYAGAPIYVQFLQRPFVVQSQGTDLRSMALQKNMTGTLLRRSYKKARTLFFGNPDQLDSIEKLGLENYIFLPQPIDTKKYRPKSRKSKPSNRTIFFSPARLDWERKGNDAAVKAFANLVKKNKNVSLKLMDWGVDVEKTKKLVKNLGIEKNVMFLKLMDKKKLIEQYNDSDVVIDQFKAKSFGLATLEAMSCEKPVIMCYSVKYFKKCYKELPPILNAGNEKEILEQMKKLCSRKKREEAGKKSRRWVEKYHSGDKVAKELIKAYTLIFKA